FFALWGPLPRFAGIGPICAASQARLDRAGRAIGPWSYVAFGPERVRSLPDRSLERVGKAARNPRSGSRFVPVPHPAEGRLHPEKRARRYSVQVPHLAGGPVRSTRRLPLGVPGLAALEGAPGQREADIGPVFGSSLLTFS